MGSTGFPSAIKPWLSPIWTGSAGSMIPWWVQRVTLYQGGIFLRNLGTRFPGNFFTDRKFWMKSHAFQKKYWSEFTHIWKESWVRNKIGMLWCHNHNELRLIEVEVNLSGISLTSYRSQFDTFFNDFFLLFEVTWRLLGPYPTIFWVMVGYEKCFSLYFHFEDF